MIWRCPVCKGPLSFDAKVATCHQSHHFDRAKQGYYNLLLSNRKQSSNPGDSKEMIKARSAFLAQDYFLPLAESLSNHLNDLKGPVNILDCGCGDGYYSHHLMNALTSHEPGGSVSSIDISKDALRLAAKQYPGVRYAVASNFDLPVMDRQATLIIQVFAPADASEIARVMSDTGELWVVSPGPQHLWELRRSLYRTPTPHPMPKSVPGFEQITQDQLQYSFELSNNETICNLLKMTPYFWQAPLRGRESVQGLSELSLTADFIITRYKKSAADMGEENIEQELEDQQPAIKVMADVEIETNSPWPTRSR